MKKDRFVVPILLLAFMLASCGPKTSAIRQWEVLDAPAQIIVHGPDAAAAAVLCQREMIRTENLLSSSVEGSDAARINAAAGSSVLVTELTGQALETALDVAALTGGAYDPTVRPLIQLWGFDAPVQGVPEDASIQAALPLVDYKSVLLSNGSVTLQQGMGLDFRVIGRGCALDMAVNALGQSGVKGAWITLGGDAVAYGTREDGTSWRMELPSTEGGEPLGWIPLNGQAACTASCRLNSFEQDGQVYHAVLDPHTGYPADSGVESATVIAPSAQRAAVLACALVVLGKEKSVSLWREEGCFDMILTLSDGRALYTESAGFLPNADNQGQIFDKIVR